MKTGEAEYQTALLDANVLYPADLRDLLLELAFHRLYRARWTNRIQEEWINALQRNQPHLSRQALKRTADVMTQAIPDAVIKNYQHAESNLNLPDPDDRHVLAAAIAGRCDTIITNNLKDFPGDILAAEGLTAQDPDTFLSSLYEQHPEVFQKAIRSIRARLKHPAYSVSEYLDLLIRRGLTNTTRRITPDRNEL